MALAGVLLTLPSLWGGFSADDHFLRMVIQGFPGMEEFKAPPLDTFVFADGTEARNQAFIERGLIPWWAAEGVRLAFWRPLASATHYLDLQIWGDWALPMHAQNLLWYGLLGLSVALVYRKFIGTPWIAGLAALLYMVDDAHAMPVGWIANRNGIMAAVFVALVLLWHDYWRRDGRYGFGFLAIGGFSIGLLCGEATLAVCGYLFGHALFLDRKGWLRGLISLAPYGAIILLWRWYYGHAGYGATGSGMYIDPVRESGLYIWAVIERLPILLNAQFAYPPSTMVMWVPTVVAIVHYMLAIAILVLCAWMFLPMLRASRTARMWAAGMVLALLPACATFPMDRILFYAGLGGMGLVAQFLGGLADEASWRPESLRWRRWAGYAATGFMAIHLVLSPLSMPVRSLTMAFIGKNLAESVDSLPKTPDVTQKDVVLMCTASDFDAWHVPIMRSSMREPVPRHTWVLTVGPESALCTRVDERTLRITVEGGFVPYPWGRMFRGFSYPFQKGLIRELDGMRINVCTLTPDGRPKDVAFEFDRPLEADTLAFFVFQDGTYKPFEPPPVGESVALPDPLMFNFDQFLDELLDSR